MTDEPGTRNGRSADAQVRAIARAVDRNGQKTAALDEQVRRMADDLARLTAAVTGERPARSVERPPDDPPDGTTPPLRSWLLAADPAQALADLGDLMAWLRAVYLCFGDAELDPCWLWHPDVVEELWWLRRAHAEAYDPESGSWLRVGDWHDRQRPGVARRVREQLLRCDLSLHRPRQRAGGRRGPRSLPAVVPLGAYGADIAELWATRRARPLPSDAQVDEAHALNGPEFA